MPTLKGWLKGLGIVFLILIVLEGGVWIIALVAFFWALFGGYDRYLERKGRRSGRALTWHNNSPRASYQGDPDPLVPLVIGYELAKHHGHWDPGHGDDRNNDRHESSHHHDSDCNDGDGGRY